MKQYSQPSILIVDDEESVTEAIQTLFELETDYRVHRFELPEEAERFAAENRVDVAISDYLMPGMNGIELLIRFKDLQPECSRILLTGHADRAHATEEIDRASLFQFLEKPWDNQQLLLAVQGGVERARLLRALREKANELDSAHSSLKTVQQQIVQAFL